MEIAKSSKELEIREKIISLDNKRKQVEKEIEEFNELKQLEINDINDQIKNYKEELDLYVIKEDMTLSALAKLLFKHARIELNPNKTEEEKKAEKDKITLEFEEKYEVKDTKSNNENKNKNKEKSEGSIYKKIIWFCCKVIVLLLFISWIADKYGIKEFSDIIQVEEIVDESRGIYKGIISDKDKKYVEIYEVRTGAVLFAVPDQECNINKAVKFSYKYKELTFFGNTKSYNIKQPLSREIISYKCI